jgi:class 3 adenylate cyclase/putative methionine-R-sulfoxide reductase with GAF domain
MGARETLDAERLARDNESLRAERRALGKVLRAVAQSEGLQHVLDEVIEAAARLCEGEYSQLYLTEGDVLRAFSYFIATDSHSVVAETAREQWALDQGQPHLRDRTTLVGRTALAREVVHLPDMLADPEYSFPLPAGSRAGLGVPILVEDDLIGVIVIIRSLEKPFGGDQIELVQTFADQAAIAIANARLIDAVERQLAQQRAISDVLRAVARSEGLDAVFDVVVAAATRLCLGDYGALYLTDNDVLRVATQQYGQPALYDFEREHPHVVDRTTAIGRAALTRDVVHIPDTHADPEYSWGGTGYTEYRALLAAPILVDGELIGAMNVVRIEPKPFAEEHIQLMKTFADQAAIAIANARLIDAVERQRTELARFVSPQVAELLSSGEGEQMLAGHRAYISCLFCDLRGFTTFAETAAPEELFELLREYHGAVGALVSEHEGTLEHFAGDGLMVFFNDPVPVEEHELKAIRFALAAQERFEELARRWRKRGTELGLGLGIAAGYATLGRIGFEGRYDYGALGPDTNLASRLSTHAEPGQTLISQRVFAAVEDAVEAEPVGELELKGFGRPVVAYEVRSVVESGV